MQPSIEDCVEQQYDEQSFHKQEIEQLSNIQQQIQQINDLQKHMNLLVHDQDDGLDIVENSVDEAKKSTQKSKEQTEQAMDNTLSLRTTKMTIAFSGIIGALTMVKGFGITVGVAVGGFLGRKIGKAAETGIREKTQG